MIRLYTPDPRTRLLAHRCDPFDPCTQCLQDRALLIEQRLAEQRKVYA